MIGKRNPLWPQLFEPIEKNLVIRKGDHLVASCRFDTSQATHIIPMGAMGRNEMCNFYMMFYYDGWLNLPNPFPFGGHCMGDQFPEISKQMPPEATTLLPHKPEAEMHHNHTMMMAAGSADGN